MNIEEEYLERAGKELAHEIDKEVLFGMLERIGWTRVIAPILKSREEYVELMVWLDEYCKHPYERRGSEVIFENSRDANWFKLRWGTI
jgi:hypothetical protein